MKFLTKAETLQFLQGKLVKASVLPQLIVTVGDWRNSEEDVWNQISIKFPDSRLAVRSSALNEDTMKYSNAGRYDSVLDVKGNDQFARAMETVIASFGDKNIDDQILIQPFLQQVKVSGVAFTIEPNTLGNYYVINYDDNSQMTNSVTSGNSYTNKLQYVFKEDKEEIDNVVIKQICSCLAELETIFETDRLDVEFAIDQMNCLYVLQVRPLCVKNKGISISEQSYYLKCIQEKIRKDNTRKPFLYGDRIIYGVMPDWNPAEIIGIRPKPLALSLYKEIITDNIWAYQRDNYGYQNLRSSPLLIDFFGLPYIDVRVSFNSFIPADLREELGEKLVTYYLDKLEAHPELHDKVEFEICYTCYTFDLPKRITALKKYGFTDSEIKEIIISLREMTKKIIDNEEGLWKKDYKKIECLEKRHQEIMDSDMDSVSKIYWLLEDCKRYGTLPFAGLARAGFIAVQLLKSLIQERIISEKEYQIFMSDLHTVSSMMKIDKKQLSRIAFLKKYGHLRPGTYDICSKRYDKAAELYFRWDNEDVMTSEESLNNSGEDFKLTLEQIKKLKILLSEHAMSDDVLGFFRFIKMAIEGREYAKFVFTRNLSDAIQLIAEMGSALGINEEDCAFADITAILKLYASCFDIKSVLENSIQAGKKKYRITQSLLLPPLVFKEQDVKIFCEMDTSPNYITLKRADGEIYLLDGEKQAASIDNKILMIPSADPGYDWIFSYSICGLITQWGGANSHMAIRANELSIPAVIGVGEHRFEELKKANYIEIDAEEKRITVIR